jgi:uncharacterized protein (TIGR02145 family)
MSKRTKVLYLPILIMGVSLMLSNACKNHDEQEPLSLPKINTSNASQITMNSAISGGNITSGGGSSVTVRGICWSTNQTPTILDSKTIDATGADNFICNLSGLAANTTYYVRAFATNSLGTAYGNVIMFTTLQESGGTVEDIDGNIYQTVTIGTQIWLAENMKVTHYNNGDTIPNVIDDIEWINLTTGAYCDYKNTESNSSIYGKLYNWYTMEDSLNICPSGWHVPTEAEWTTLSNFLGGDGVAGGKLKETGTTHWNSPNTGATNETGFTALPGGCRVYTAHFDSTFFVLNRNAYFWSLTDSGYQAKVRYLMNDRSSFFRDEKDKGWGFSVRCIKD